MRVVSRSHPAPVLEVPTGAERSIAGGRYVLHRALGRGGMAVVYEALDRMRDRRVALKQLRTHAESTKHARNADLFELEFHTLAQLAHPRIVEVYDFGLDPSGAYYTMELLDGGDLSELAPLPWQAACAVARDVCSALSLLHSRRFVHRDISPRNVRRTGAGNAKLIDFGALAPMGPSKLLVGTPPCCAPESVHLQSLDGRTDLYALGATLYYMLVGRHAYAAPNFAALHASWAHGFPPPSAFVKDVPPALDTLVLELMRLEPDARPASAAEVVQRLAAIDGTSSGEESQFAQAYLATPPLVGRDAELARASRRLKRVAAGSGRSVLVEGPAGAGRSRYLDRVVLDAALLGLASVRADAEDARPGDFSVAAALARQLLELAPELARGAAQPHIAILGGLLPELSPRPATPPDDAGEHASRPQLSAALGAWLRTFARVRPLVIAIDDFDRIDEASASLFAMLAAELDDEGLGLLVSVELDASTGAAGALKLLREHSTRIPLANLIEPDSERLLRSLFGELPKLSLLTHRLHALSAGNPRDLMDLAKHLLDSGAFRFTNGSWSLTVELEGLPLPSSMALALKTRLSVLHESARELAWSLALCPDQTFAPAECALLCGAPDPAVLFGELEALRQAGLVRRTNDAVGLAHSSWTSILRETLPVDREFVLHQRLGMVFQRRGDDFRAGSQWLQGGEIARALDMLVAYAEAALKLASTQDTVRGRIAIFRTPAPDWFETYVRAIRACDELARPRRHKHLLLSRLVGLCAIYDIHDLTHSAMLLEQLRCDSGLADYAELGDAPPGERLKLALARAQERYQNTPEPERVTDVLSAIRELARATGSSVSMLTRAMDRDGLRVLPDLGPLTPLSPGLRVLALASEGLRARLSGRSERARCIYEELLALLMKPDRAGLDATVWEITRQTVTNVLGMIEASRGLSSCLGRAATLAENPTFEVNAVVVHLLHSLFQADALAADGCRKQMEHLRIQNGSRQFYEGAHLVWELDAHAMSDDITGLRHLLDELLPLARRYPGWVPVARTAAAELQRSCGANGKALAEIEGALALAKPGEHQVWPSAAACELRILLELGRSDEALAKADAYLASAEAALREVPAALSLLRACAFACAGKAPADEHPSATAERICAGLVAQGVSGLHIGYAHELRARIALALGDQAGFELAAAECGAIYRTAHNPALSAKHQRLLDAARSSDAHAERAALAADSFSSLSPSRIAVALRACRDSEQRARAALILLVSQSGAQGGFMFGVTPAGLECTAQVGGLALSEALVSRSREYFASQVDGEMTTSTENEVDRRASADWLDETGRRYRPVLLSHQQAGRVAITGLAVIAVAESGSFSYPAQIASEISSYFASIGDNTTLLSLD
ncbi:MAG TPA: serine/threonine-protein kinase [Polyangiales bacterium]|nr:serine/threonine-protein kinase [Polyangiales bacterium]